MHYYKNGRILAKAFLEGETDGRVGNANKPGNLKIIGNQLIHYSTPKEDYYRLITEGV